MESTGTLDRNHSSESFNSSVYQGYPFYSFVFRFEKYHDQDRQKTWMQENWHSCFYLAAAYLCLIGGLKIWMRNRHAMNIRGAVFLWDLGLAVFSICGMLRMVPEIAYVTSNFGIEFSVCNSNYNSVTAFWGSIFVFSKAFELLDTVFIVLKKQKLTALHCIHHVTTLIVTWYHFVDVPALFRWVCGMNYSVHAFMYTYFALKAAKVPISDTVSMTITLAQISQMIFGLSASIYSLGIIYLGHPCTTSISVACTCVFTYASFLYLFVNFFIHKYRVLNYNKKKTM